MRDERGHTRIGKDFRISLGGEHKEGAVHDTIRGQIQAMIKGAITGVYVDTGVRVMSNELDRSGSKM